MAERIIKILIMGDSGVGKTCVLLRFSENIFSDSHTPTIGIDYKSKILTLSNREVKV